MLRFAITPGTVRPGTVRLGTVPPGAATGQAEAESLLARVAHLAPVDFLLVREKQLAAGELLSLCLSIGQMLRRTSSLPYASAGNPTRLLIAGRLDVALAVHQAGVPVAGVQLSAAPGELTPAQVRRLLPHAYVPVSCHTVDQVRGAREADASAILFAPVFGKVVAGQQVVPGQGLKALEQACQAAGSTPVFALGGVTEALAEACQSAGAAGIAGIRLFFPA